MTSEFIDFFSQFDFLMEEDIEDLLTVTEFKQFPKGGLISEANNIDMNYYLVVKGIVDQYVLTSNGEFRSFHFAPEGTMIGSLESIQFRKPSRITNEALEDCLIAVMDSEETESLMNTNPNLRLLENSFLKKSLYDLYDRVIFFTSLTPKERYIHIIENQPELLQRVPQKYIASYVGVSQVSLSRIKSRVENSLLFY